MVNYVKFQRGSTTAFEALKEANGLSNNTLYFVYDTDDTSGKLYLGSRLISSVGSGAGISNLKQLEDVLITNLQAKDILMADSDGNWKNVSIADLANEIAAQQGLGFTVNENIFNFTPTKQLTLNGFDGASANQIPMKSVEGKLTWTDKPDLTTINQKVGNLETGLQDLQDNMATKIAQEIAKANHLTYKKVNSIADATEINTVYLIPNGETTEDGENKYEEYMIVDGYLEKLGEWGVNLSDYVTMAEFTPVKNSVLQLEKDTLKLKTDVGDITQLFGYTEETPVTIVDQLNLLNNILIWQDIILPQG